MNTKFSNYLTDLRTNTIACNIVNSILFIILQSHANDVTNFDITNENLIPKLTKQQQQQQQQTAASVLM